VFVLEGVSLWVINEVSNTNKHLRVIYENQYNMWTVEETTSLALVFCSSKKARYFSSVFWCKINPDQNRWSLGITQNLNKAFKALKMENLLFTSRPVQEEFHAISCFPLCKSNVSSVYA